MQAQNPTQRLLFVGLMFMVVLSARLLVMNRAGAFLLAIVIVISGLCIGFRMVERLVAAMWSLAGMLATKFFRKPEDVRRDRPRTPRESVMGDLQPGLLNLANWTGNVVLPIGAGLILACGIYQFSKGQELEKYVYGAMGALMGSGLLRLAEVISQQATDADQYMVMLLTLTNFVGNVLLPFYAAIEIVRLVLGLGGVFERLYVGDDWLRHLMAAMGALMVSGLLRLLEHFVAAA